MEPPLDQPYYGAPFGAAFARFWKKGFTFTGRASRSEYWFAYLATTLVFVVLYVLAGIVTAAGASSYSSGMMSFGSALVWIALLYALATLIPSLAVAWRRLHDTNKSGAAYFVAFIPFVGGIILLVLLAMDSIPAGARFDVAPAAPWPTPPAPDPANAADDRTGPAQVAPVDAATSTGIDAQGAPVQPLPPAAAATLPPPTPVVAAPPVVTIPPAGAGQEAGTSSRTVAPTTGGVIAGIPGVAALPEETRLRPTDPGREAQEAARQDDDLDSTRLSPVASAAWVVVLPDGRRLPVASPLYFGRAPVSTEHPDALLVPIDDPARSMSKTHARIALAAGELEVTDLHSTNGTKLLRNGDPVVSLTPGIAQRVGSEASVSFGDYVVSLLRNA